MSTRFVLVDRDGTIIQERDQLDDPHDLELIDGAAEAIRRLRDDLGLGVVVVTNQANVGRGVLSPTALDAIHERLRERLASDGATLDAILVCPHAPEEGCGCRKPAPGLALRAAARFGFDPTMSFVVGDHAGDLGMGRAVGATTIHVRTGHGADEAERAGPLADHVAPDLAGATDIIAALVTGDTS